MIRRVGLHHAPLQGNQAVLGVQNVIDGTGLGAKGLEGMLRRVHGCVPHGRYGGEHGEILGVEVSRQHSGPALGNMPLHPVGQIGQLDLLLRAGFIGEMGVHQHEGRAVLGRDRRTAECAGLVVCRRKRMHLGGGEGVAGQDSRSVLSAVKVHGGDEEGMGEPRGGRQPCQTIHAAYAVGLHIHLLNAHHVCSRLGDHGGEATPVQIGILSVENVVGGNGQFFHDVPSGGGFPALFSFF